MIGPITLVVAVILVSWWMTQLTAPRPVAKLPSMQSAPQGNSMKMLSKLFGENAARSPSLEGLQLEGVFANSKGGGFATFRTREGAVSAFVGDDVAPGVQLKQIEGDRVIVLSAGMPKELRLHEDSGQSASPVQQSAAFPTQQATANIPQAVEASKQASPNRRVARPQEE